MDPELTFFYQNRAGHGIFQESCLKLTSVTKYHQNHPFQNVLNNFFVHIIYLLDPRPWPEGSYEIGSVRPSIRLSVSFLGIGSLVFFKLSMVLGAHI